MCRMFPCRLVTLALADARPRRFARRLDARAAGAAGEPEPLRRDALAQHRPVSRRADQGGGRRAEPAVHLLHRHGERRRLEDHRRRAARGSRSSTISRPDRSAGCRSRRPIRTSSTSAAAKGCRGRTWRSATASTSPPTPGRRGRISACATRSRFRRSPSIRRTRTGCSSPRSAIPYGPNQERGIFRSTDGGQTFDRVLFKDENTGGKDVDIDPSNPDIVYATMWEQRQGPWENGAWSGTHGGIFKSIDGGTTWKPLTQGLPDGIVNAELAIAPSNPRRVYVTRRGERQRHRHLPIRRRRRDVGAQHDRRASGQPHQRSRAARASRRTPTRSSSPTSSATSRPTAARRSCRSRARPAATTTRTSGGTRTIRTSCCSSIDQGAVVTLNGGQTWSSWFTQPTAALYHVMTDNAFPYRVCGGQQDSGSVCVASRGNDGQITFRDWHPVGVEEYGYAAPDPLDPDLVYGGKVTRYDRRTGQVSNVGPVEAGRGGGRGRGGPPARPTYRTVRTQPVVFSTVDPHALFYGNNVLWKTIDGGINWKQISPDLTRETWDVPKNVGTYASSVQTRERGAIPRAGHLHDRPVVPRHQPHLDRHRRRRDRDDGRRRPALDERHAAAADRVHEGVHHRSRPLRSADRVRRGQHAAPRRHEPAHLPHARRRQDVEGDRQRHSRRRAGQRRARGSEAQGAALRRLGNAGLRLVRRRRPLAVAAAEHGASSVRDLVDQRRRPRRRHARPRHLDSRRHHAAAADRRDAASATPPADAT